MKTLRLLVLGLFVVAGMLFLAGKAFVQDPSAKIADDPVEAIKNAKGPVYLHSLAGGDSLVHENPTMISTWWHSIYPPNTFCHVWHVIDELDNGIPGLNPSDRLKIQHAETGSWVWVHVEEVTKTLILTLEPDHLDTAYVEYTGGYDSLMNPDTDPDYHPICTWWHEIRPTYSRWYHLSSWIDNGDGILSTCDTIDLTCANPDVDKPHAPGPECWVGNPGYEYTSTQAASANVIYAECCFCCDFTPEEIYESIVDQTGNVGQFPEQEVASMQAWVAANCPDCQLQIEIAHRGYQGQGPVNPENVTFDWADQEIASGEHVKIWVWALTPGYPPAPTGREGVGSQELTYKGRTGNQARVHDSDCDKGGNDDDFYLIGSDDNGDFLTDYFGPGNHGYLMGVISVSGNCDKSWWHVEDVAIDIEVLSISDPTVPTLTQWGLIVLVALLIISAIYIMVRRRRATVPA